MLAKILATKLCAWGTMIAPFQSVGNISVRKYTFKTGTRLRRCLEMPWDAQEELQK